MELDLGGITRFIAAHQGWALPIVFLVSFGESFAFVSLLIPGTTILAACGALVPSGALPLTPLLVGAIAGAVAGDGISFWLGRRYGAALTGMWPFSRHPGMVAKGEAYIRRWGIWGIAIGRFFGPLRAVVPLTAGMAGVAVRPFWAANVASACVWAPLVMLPGMLVGWAAEGAGPEAWWVMGGVGVVALVVFAAVKLRRGAGSA